MSMNKNTGFFKRTAALLLCTALLAVSGIFPQANAQTLEGLKNEYNKLQQQIEANKDKLAQIESQMASNEEKLTTLSQQADAISGQLDILNSEIELLNADIAVYDKEIAALDKKIDDAKTKIQKANDEIDETQALISERLRATYMAGSTSWIEIILEADSVSSLLLRMQLIASVTENDNALIARLEDEMKKLETLEKELSEDRAQVDSKRAVLLEKKSELDKKASELTAKQNDFNDNYLEISNLMTSLDKSSSAYQEELRKQQRQKEAFERQIEQMVANGSQSGDDYYFNDGIMMWPVPYSNSYISAGYGYYDPEDDGTYTFHPAIDIVVRENGVNVSKGKRIVAAQSGKVLTRGYSNVGGNYLTIDHGDGYRTYYGHCSSIIVSAGEYVEKGETIAYMGATGYVTGPHLHFQVMQVVNGVVEKLNPLDFVTPPN